MRCFRLAKQCSFSVLPQTWVVLMVGKTGEQFQAEPSWVFRKNLAVRFLALVQVRPYFPVKVWQRGRLIALIALPQHELQLWPKDVSRTYQSLSSKAKKCSHQARKRAAMQSSA